MPLHRLVTRASYFRRRCARRRAVHKSDLYGLTRRLAEAKPTAPTNQNRSPWFPMQTRPRRTQCGVGADDSFVTNAECERTRIPVAPLPQADHGAHLAGASSRFLCLSFFAAAKKVSAAPHRGNANRPLTMQGKARKPEQGKARKPEQGKAKAPGTLPKSAAGNKPPFNRRAPYCAATSPTATPQTAPDTHWRNSQNAKTPTA